MQSNNILLTWNSCKKEVLKGFTHLLKNGEFVDMTFAAEGQFMKVHQNLVALASPYIKQLLQSAPCPHPIIFLHDVSHEVLNYIIEYIYSGEVQVPVETLESFIKISKDLNIKGIEHFSSAQKQGENIGIAVKSESNNITHDIQNSDITLQDLMDINDFPSAEKQNIDLFSSMESNNRLYETQTNHLNLHQDEYDDLAKLLSDSYNEGGLKHIDYNDACLLFDSINQNTTFENINYTCEDIVRKYNIDNSKTKDLDCGAQEKSFDSLFDIDIPDLFSINTFNIDIACEGKKECDVDKSKGKEIIPIEKSLCVQHENWNKNINYPTIDLDALMSYTLRTNKDLERRCLYSFSNRGAIQLIYDNYIYSIIYESQSGHIRRWRCVDYRRVHCRARLDTENQILTVR
ncbi:hypothetical protein O3G_MSEX011260 [Manduca sexta]|nr:hypothetical protein O3G_MSEX011260 [Manduca sexta]